MQAPEAQGIPIPQVPSMAQVCWVAASKHFVTPGTHAPEQLPPEQMNGQIAPLCQVPFASHVCGVLLTHCLLVGTHTPAQLPLVHTYGHAAPLCHVPVESQVWGVR